MIGYYSISRVAEYEFPQLLSIRRFHLLQKGGRTKFVAGSTGVGKGSHSLLLLLPAHLRSLVRPPFGLCCKFKGVDRISLLVLT